MDRLTVHAAMLPGGTPPGQDRWGVSQRAAVVLDGASAYSPEAPPADTYVDTLLPALLAQVDHGDLRDALRAAIAETAAKLDLQPGAGPSSTVLILRAGEDVEIGVLGDSTAVIGHPDGTTTRLNDDRMDHVASEQRQAYREALRQGGGYGPAHRERLQQLQRTERAYRNRPDGFWIAEADPTAADHMLLRSFRCEHVSWVVLATDGIDQHIDRTGTPWATVAEHDGHELAQFLREAQQWEADVDPDGAELPRSKRHDDKTILVWHPGSTLTESPIT